MAKGSHEENTLFIDVYMMHFKNNFIDMYTIVIDDIDHEEKNKIIEKLNMISGFISGIDNMIEISNTPLKEEYNGIMPQQMN